MSKIFVTGAAGFIGSHMLHDLKARGHEVVGCDDLSGGTLGNLTIDDEVIPQPCESPFVRDHVQHGGYDTLVHLAANAREGASQFQPFAVTSRNLNAYMGVLGAAIQGGVKNVVLFSSMATYGAQKPPFDESYDLDPEDVYAWNKTAMEGCTEILAKVHEFNYMVIRPHNVFGENQALYDRFRNAVGIFMNLIMRGEPITIYGDGRQTRAFSYIGDSLPSFTKCAEQCEELHGEHINIGGIEAVSVLELAQTVIEAMGHNPASYPIEHLPDRPQEVKHAHCTFEKSQALLGYEERAGWRLGVHRMAEWAKQQGPQEWQNNDPLEIINDKTPEPWRSMALQPVTG